MTALIPMLTATNRGDNFDEWFWWYDDSPEYGTITTHAFYIHQNGELIAKPAETPMPPPEDFVPTGFVQTWLPAGATEDEVITWLKLWVPGRVNDLEKWQYAFEKMKGTFLEGFL